MTHFCPDCFHDTSLASQLVKARPNFPSEEKCDFHPSKKGIPDTFVAKIVDGAFRANYGWADYNPHFEVGDSLDVILDELVCPDNERIHEALKSALENSDDYDFRDGGEPFYDDGQNFVKYENSYNPLPEMWNRFKFDISHRQRFFNDDALDRLEQIFSELHHQQDKSGRSPIYSVSPGENDWTVYRARRIDDEKSRKLACEIPQIHLAPPPDRLRKAGRLNASGVCCFYGAFDLETCLSELRPPVGSHVVTAAFELVEPITVLDMTLFKETVKRRSIFSPVRQERLNQWGFMQFFRSEITKPILPDDEIFDYIPTQAVAEFIHVKLAGKLGKPMRRIDAIIYESAQRPKGLNIALFGDAALVEGSDEPQDEFAISKAEQSLNWDDGAGYVIPTLESALGRTPRLRCVKTKTKVHKIIGADIAHEENWDSTDANSDF
jgi:hypothetical protein